MRLRAHGKHRNAAPPVYRTRLAYWLEGDDAPLRLHVERSTEGYRFNLERYTLDERRALHLAWRQELGTAP